MTSQGENTTFQQMIEAVGDFAIYRVDVEGRVMTWSASAERIYGWRREDVDNHRDGAGFTRVECSDSNYLARHFLAAIVANRDHDGVFPRLNARRIANRSFDAQRGERRLRPAFDERIGVESQMMLAARTNARALQDDRLAVRTDPGLAGCRDTAVHVAVNAWASRPNRTPPCRACVTRPPR